MHDIAGRILLQQTFNSQVQLSTSTLIQGIYREEIKDESGKSVKSKVVKV